MYIHEQNIKNKIDGNYSGLAPLLKQFHQREYLPMRKQAEALDFCSGDAACFDAAAQIFNTYYDKLRQFSRKNKISSQSKFESTYLEEISTYLFHNLPQIRNGELGIYNKHVFAGLKIEHGSEIDVITKDVDFCIGRKVTVRIDDSAPKSLVIPVVAVEVKTYLDATMLGEIKSSGTAIRNATPTARTYVLMGYRALKDEQIIAVRNDASLNEMFAMRQKSDMPMEAAVIREYWHEIADAVHDASESKPVPRCGRLMNG